MQNYAISTRSDGSTVRFEIENNELSCSGNQLTNLDLSHCPNITYLSCSDNQLTNLDLSHCPNITYLSCSDNQLTLDAILSLVPYSPGLCALFPTDGKILHPNWTREHAVEHFGAYEDGSYWWDSANKEVRIKFIKSLKN